MVGLFPVKHLAFVSPQSLIVRSVSSRGRRYGQTVSELHHHPGMYACAIPFGAHRTMAPAARYCLPIPSLLSFATTSLLLLTTTS